MQLLPFQPRPGHPAGAGRASPSRAAPAAPTLLFREQTVPHHPHRGSAPALTAGPSVLLRVFCMCCLTCCSPFFLPCLAAIQRLRWKPVSPEMAMCMLMVSRKRTREPSRRERQSLGHTGVETHCQTCCSCQHAPPRVTELQVLCSGCFCPG